MAENSAPSQWQWLGWDGARTRDPGASELELVTASEIPPPGSSCEPAAQTETVSQLPSWMPTIPFLTAVLAGPSLLGVHFSTRSAVAPLAQEPTASSTLDVEAGREDEFEEEAADAAEQCWEEGEASVRPLEGKLNLADYPARKRSQEDMLPLTVEKRMMELKQRMWGEVQGGFERKAWKESFSSLAQNHDARVTRANQRCCPTEALNVLVSVCVTVCVMLGRSCLLHLSSDERGYTQKYRVLF
jgi:hypothetical protein